eukprot:352507-Chlamydomonas_euryale.AAC.15
MDGDVAVWMGDSSESRRRCRQLMASARAPASTSRTTPNDLFVHTSSDSLQWNCSVGVRQELKTALVSADLPGSCLRH